MYFKAAKIKAAVSLPKLRIIQLFLFKIKPTMKYFAYLWLQLKESLAVDSFECLFKVLTCNYVGIIVCVLLVCLHGFY